jgi:hypothetical protein
VSMFVKGEGPNGRAKIHSDGPKHALGLAQYLRAIGYSAWIEDTNGNEIDEQALKTAISSRRCTLLLMQLAASHQSPGDVGSL